MQHTFDGEAAREQIRSVPAGPARTEAYLQAIHQADLSGDSYWRQNLRADMVLYTGFYDDKAKILPVCAEYFALYDEEPDALPSQLSSFNCYLVAHNAAELCVLLPQLEMSVCLGLMDQLDQVVNRIQNGMRRRNMALCEFYLYTQPELSEQWYRRFIKPCEDEFSSCRACEQSFKVWYKLQTGQIHDAQELARPIFSGKYTCDSVPTSTYADFIQYYLNQGDMEPAKMLYQKLLYKGIHDKSDLGYLGAALRCMAFTNPKKGMEWLRQGLSWSVGMWNQQDLYFFYKGAWCLCCAPELEKTLLKPPTEHPLMKIEPPYTAPRLAEWFYQEAYAIAQRFDTRNHLPWYTHDLQRARETAPSLFQLTH